MWIRVEFSFEVLQEILKCKLGFVGCAVDELADVGIGFVGGYCGGDEGGGDQDAFDGGGDGHGWFTYGDVYDAGLVDDEDYEGQDRTKGSRKRREGSEGNDES